MIYRRLEDGTVLVDRRAAVAGLRFAASTIRARCTPVACDLVTRGSLYELSSVYRDLEGCVSRVRLRKRGSL